MEQKNFQLIVSAMCFVIGGLFIISNTPDITANVIGASGPEAGFTSVMGIIILVASGIYFMMSISLDDKIRTERTARSPGHSATDHIAHEYKDRHEDAEKEKYEEKKE